MLSADKNYPFPYIGGEQGESIYDFNMYNRVYLSVLFKHVTDEEKEALTLTIPTIPFSGYCWEDNLLVLSSEFYFFLKSPRENLYDNDHHDDFNKYVETWLLKTHQTYPIAAAFVRHHFEARDETTPTTWHIWSTKFTQSLLPLFQDVVARKDLSSEKGLVLIQSLAPLLSDHEKKELTEDYQCCLAPGETELDFYIQGKQSYWTKFIENYDEENSYYKRGLSNIHQIPNIEDQIFETENKVLREAICQLVKILPLVDVKERMSRYTIHFQKLFYLVFLAAWQEKRDDVVQQLRTISSERKQKNKNFAILSAPFELEMIKEGRFKEAISYFDFLLTIPNLDTSAFVNALYVIQHDNSGLPIDHKRNKRFLALSLPDAEKNPAIFFNAAGVYVEMSEYGEALNCLETMVKHRQFFRKGEQQEIANQLEQATLLAPLRKDHRFEEVVLALRALP